MKKILCPIDFSDTSQNALAYAAKFAQATGSELVIFNVQSVFELTPQELVRGRGMTIEAIDEHLERMSRQIAQAFKISCYAEVQSSASTLAKTIANVASGYDLIVMGTNGPDDIYQFLTGSNAYKASVKSSIPVMLIPENCGFSQITKVVYAFDYVKERKLPLNQFLPWLKVLKCELSVLQVLEGAYSQEVEEEMKELQFISQQLYADDVKLNFDAIHSDEVARSINSYILRNQPDLLALCTIHRNLIERIFHSSLIKNISGGASYPVFVFHN